MQLLHSELESRDYNGYGFFILLFIAGLMLQSCGRSNARLHGRIVPRLFDQILIAGNYAVDQ